MRIITAALPYANGPLHLGHIRSTYLPADIYKRFSNLFGVKALYVCASDEHGTPIALEAQKQGKSPEELSSFYHKMQEEDFSKLNISFDIFHSTHSKENEELTLFFFEKLKEKGLIYKKNVLQYYCEELERFMPDRYVVGTCPYCKAENQYADQCEACGKTLKAGELISPKCIITGKPPKLKESSHYFFKLTALKEELSNFIERGNFQEEVKNYVRDWLAKLMDWDIVRDFDWGIRVPNTNQVFYVWFDAPIGYISSLKALTKNWKEYWNSSEVIHFIGKDIIYHHYLFWPAMLLGVSFNLPSSIPVRGYLTLEGQKFSKSRGWYITLREFLEIFPADYLRYYMTSITPYSLTDANFSLAEFKEKINNELISNYGNLINRLKLASGLELVDPSNSFKEEALGLVNDYEEVMNSFRFKEGLEITMKIIKEANSILSKEEPWKLEKTERAKTMGKVVYLSLIGSILLYPFIPSSSKKALSILNFKLLEEFEREGKNIDFSSLKTPERINTPFPLFKRVEEKEVLKLKELLSKRSKR